MAGILMSVAFTLAAAQAAPHGSAGQVGSVTAQAASQSASYIREADYRVARIGYRIGLAGARFCSEPYPLTGLSLHHLAEYSVADRPEAAKLYGLDRGPGVLAVIEDSPAARGGLAAGDVLLTVNGKPFPSPTEIAQGQDNEDARPEIEASEAFLESQLRGGPAQLVILRGGREMAVRLEPVSGCPARVRLARSNQVNAFANRGYAIMTTALLDFLKNDDELAVVLGHEIAHTILNHPAELKAEGVPEGGLLRSFGKNARRVRATEEEADRLGLRLAWAAGYDVTAAILYWRRYYAKYDLPLQLFRTHPSLGARERLIRDVIADLGDAESEPGAERPELGEGPLSQR